MNFFYLYTFVSASVVNQTSFLLVFSKNTFAPLFSDRINVGQLEVRTGVKTHLPRLMTPLGIPVGVLKAGSSFSPSSTALFLNS